MKYFDSNRMRGNAGKYRLPWHTPPNSIHTIPVLKIGILLIQLCGLEKLVNINCYDTPLLPTPNASLPYFFPKIGILRNTWRTREKLALTEPEWWLCGILLPTGILPPRTHTWPFKTFSEGLLGPFGLPRLLGAFGLPRLLEPFGLPRLQGPFGLPRLLGLLWLLGLTWLIGFLSRCALRIKDPYLIKRPTSFFMFGNWEK